MSISDEPLTVGELVDIASQAGFRIQQAFKNGQKPTSQDLNTASMAKAYAERYFGDSLPQLNAMGDRAISDMTSNHAQQIETRNQKLTTKNQDVNIASLTANMTENGRGLTAEQVASIVKNGSYKRDAEGIQFDSQALQEGAERFGFKTTTEYMDALENVSDAFYADPKRGKQAMLKHGFAPDDINEFRNIGLDVLFRQRMQKDEVRDEDGNFLLYEDVKATEDIQRKSDILGAMVENGEKPWDDGYDRNVLNETLGDSDEPSLHSIVTRSFMHHEGLNLNRSVDQDEDEAEYD